MKFRVDFLNGQYSKFINGAENLKDLLRNRAFGPEVKDVRVVYKSGVTDSVMDRYKKYIRHQDPNTRQ
ncbi:MAG: hypothetical protein OSJ71_06585 [Acetatifactor sp.]|nr:hypothetical protein [Acetatifactor sp.]